MRLHKDKVEVGKDSEHMSDRGKQMIARESQQDQRLIEEAEREMAALTKQAEEIEQRFMLAMP